MTGVNLRHSGAILASAIVVVSLTALAPADVAAAEPKCGDARATIIGTSEGEVIKGTPDRDVILALGGDDIVYGLGGDDVICGGPGDDKLMGGPGNDELRGMAGRDRVFGGKGHDKLLGGAGADRLDGGDGFDDLKGMAGRDRLYGGGDGDMLRGNAGDDRLLGGAGHDDLDGGYGEDTCLPGPASGPHHDCEVVPPAKPQNLAIAFSDTDGDDRYGPGDVLISRLFDTNGDGIPSKGDTIYMGEYPTTFAMTSFADWGVDEHTVIGPAESPGGMPPYSLSWIAVRSKHGSHYWGDPEGGAAWEMYSEDGPVGQDLDPWFVDGIAGRGSMEAAWDELLVPRAGALPSRPESEADRWREGEIAWGDQRFIDVVVYP